MVAALLLAAAIAISATPVSTPDWARYARIAGNGLDAGEAPRILREAAEAAASAIEVDNDITGRYDSFLDPAAKLADLKAFAVAAHAKGQHAFVYTAGTECITGAAAGARHTLLKDHPDWLQRDLAGKPAVFTGGAAFWIEAGDEDVWVTPLAPEWRRLYMERIRQIASTGIDGVYVDIPYWMTHFDGWEDSWASFDAFTVAEFRKRTGLEPPKADALGNWKDAGFRAWVAFRVDVITEFMAGIDRTVKAANPKCLTIAEIYPGYGEDALRVGADVWSLYGVVDAIAHEYEPEEALAAKKSPLDWLRFLAGMHTFRAFAGTKPSWMLCYSWDGQPSVSAKDAMLTLACAEVMAGCNDWDPKGHNMAGTNDAATRREIFTWIGHNQELLYASRTTLAPVGVWFSPSARLASPEAFTKSYTGLLWLLMTSHLEFTIVTPRNRDAFAGKVLLVPGLDGLDATERGWVDACAGRGIRVLDLAAEGRDYAGALEAGFSRATGSSRLDPQVEAARTAFAAKVRPLLADPAVEIEAPPFVVASIAKAAGKPRVFLVNVNGIRPAHAVTPTPVSGIRVSFAAGRATRIRLLPFMGKVTDVKTDRAGGRLSAILPPLERGAIVWCQ